MRELLIYLNSLPLPERASFAMRCGTTVGYLKKAISAGQALGVPTCVSIERESGGVVTRKHLRPHDWAENWPELITGVDIYAESSAPDAKHAGQDAR